MERQFHNEDFERFLRDKVNQYRMYPSDKVWKGIYSALHTRRRWYAFSALFLLLTTGVIITYYAFYNNPEQTRLTDNQASNVTGSGHDNDASQPAPFINKVTELNTNPNKQAGIPGLLQKNEQNVSTGDVYTVLPDKSPVSSESAFPGLKIFSPIAIPENNLRIYMDTYLASGPGLFRNSQPGAVKNITETGITEKTIVADKDKIDIEQASLALASRQAPVQISRRPPRITAQVYFTPTISYRKLSENKSYANSPLGQSQPFNYNQFIDVNNVVKHKPAMGLEVGFDTRYAITENLSAKGGLQFNISRYDIGAYFHPTEFTTIALNSGGYGADSITALSNYRNSNSYSPNWLENFYFQVSIPIGAEIILIDNKKAQWGIAGTIQPTYNLGERAYLLTTDYKNYVKVPNLMRRWNLNTGIETFVTYSTGRIKWQVGPQVRYQHLSSFVSRYPVNENLFDIGLKVGAKINKK